MKARVLLVRDGLDGAAPWISQALRHAGLNVRTISRMELADAAPADVVLLRISDRDPVAAWLPAAELVARVRVVLRYSAWLGESSAAALAQ